jgi:hypothetical protein
VETARRLHSSLLPFVLQSQKEIDSSLNAGESSRDDTENYTNVPIDQISCKVIGD